MSSALAGAILTGTSGIASAQSQPVYQFDIPAENLSQALKDFSAASSQQILYSDELIGNRKSPALHGTYTVDQALAILLDGTGLHVAVSKAGVPMVAPKNSQAASTDGAAQRNQDGTIETVVVSAAKRGPELLKD